MPNLPEPIHGLVCFLLVNGVACEAWERGHLQDHGAGARRTRLPRLWQAADAMPEVYLQTKYKIWR